MVGKILEKDTYGLRLRRADRRVRQPGVQGHHRPDQGGAHRIAGRRLSRRPLITTEAMVAELPKKESPGDAGAAAAWVEWAGWTIDRAIHP